jgi:hypothetical protein
MKRILLVCLLMLFVQSLAFGATDCKIVQFPDRAEVVCIGDSQIKPASRASTLADVNQVNNAGALSSTRIDGTAPLTTMQDTYDKAIDGDVIEISGTTISGPLLANRTGLNVVSFKGGYNSSYTQIAGETTTILGRVVLQQGRVNVNAIKVRPGNGSIRLPVNLGTAGDFVILAKTGVSASATTHVTGDIGVSPEAATSITGFDLIADSTNTFSTSALVTGKIYAANYTPPTPAKMTAAVSDMETAFTDAAGRSLPDFTELGAGNISGLTLVPGLYKWGTGLLITDVGVTISGSATDVWIFQIAGDLTVNNGGIITLSGGAQAKNIFWQVSGKTTLGTTADFKGIILGQTLISFDTGAKLTGRALAQSAVTLNEETAITAPNL